MEKKELAKGIYEKSYSKGHFTEYLFESDPQLLVAIAKEMKSLIPKDTEVVAGIELGGIPLVTAVSIETGIVSAFVRKKPKDGRTVEGATIEGKNVCIIEDVSTKGKQMLKSIRKLRCKGAKIECIVCVIQKNKEAVDIFEKEGLHLIPVFTMEDMNEIINSSE